MGCTSLSNSQIKNPQIRKFFEQCQIHGFTRSQVIKITEYQYQYERGTKKWISKQEKSIFNEQYPVLLSPNQPDEFDKLIGDLNNFKQLYPSQFKNFPQNLGMLLTIGDKFPTFKAELLGTHRQSIIEIHEPTIFIFWKIDQSKSINKQPLIQSRNIINRFKDENNEPKYLETAYQRAKQMIKRQFNLIGICLDTQDKKYLYEQNINSNENHIWINQNDQASQVFRFAQSITLELRSIEQSLYIVNQQGVFLGCIEENFGDPNFIHEINDIIDDQNSLNNNQKEEIRYQEFKKQIETKIRRDDYQKVKKLITKELPNRENKPIGDTFNLQIKKMTYYFDYQKIDAIYYNPIFQAAGSKKYKQNSQELINFIQDYTPIAHMQCDFKEHHSLNKQVFFQSLTDKIKSKGFNDIKFILEKQMTLIYEDGKFKSNSYISSIHNSPMSVSSVYSRKEALSELAKTIFGNSNYSHKEQELLKGFFNNPYGLTTSFYLGTLYSPIPNVYQIQHNDQPIHSSIYVSTIKIPNKGIFDSKIVQSVDQSADNQQFDIIEQIKSGNSQIELSGQWDGDNQVEQNYDQIDTIHQINNEVLIIYLIDYQLKQQVELLQQLLEYIKRNQWPKEIIRVVGLGKDNIDFEKYAHKFEEFMKTGSFQPWFPLQINYLGVNFSKMLSDLYGLEFNSPFLVIDQQKRLVFRGMPDLKFTTLLNKIINNQQHQIIHSVDRPLKQRIDLAQYQKQWKIIKQYINEIIQYSDVIKEVQKYIEKMPLQKNEFWKLQMNQFSLWNENGQFIRKCFEKPQIIYKFDRQELSIKFYNIIEEIQRKVGKAKIEILDLNSDNLKEKSTIVGTL